MATCMDPGPPAAVCNYRDTINFSFPAGDSDDDYVDSVWSTLRSEAEHDSMSESFLHKFYHDSILSHTTFESALAGYLAGKLSSRSMPANAIYDVILSVFSDDPSITAAARADLRAARDRDPACSAMVHCFLFFKGFLALQAYRISHDLRLHSRRALALYIQSRGAEVFSVDIHPGACIGAGVLLDHATGVVVGETAVIGDDVSISHGVTLGGTGKESGDRHPKIGDGVLVGAGTHILGNVKIGESAKIGAGSVVLKNVPAKSMVVGNPARLIGE